MQCPTCPIQLQITHRHGVEIDFCPRCRGVWLDRGELDKLIERSMSGDDRVASPGSQRESTPSRSARRDFTDDDDDDRYPGQRGKRRKGWLGDLFDFG